MSRSATVCQLPCTVLLGCWRLSGLRSDPPSADHVLRELLGAPHLAAHEGRKTAADDRAHRDEGNAALHEPRKPKKSRNGANCSVCVAPQHEDRAFPRQGAAQSSMVFQHPPPTLFCRNTACRVAANAISTSDPTIHSCSVADIMPTIPGHARKSKNARPRRAPRMSHTTPTSTRKMIVTATSGRPGLQAATMLLRIY